MTINALNSGARIWLADFEDASAPTWENVVLGQVNMADAYTRNIDFTDERTGKSYALRPDEELATVVMRPRGWHLDERHLVDADGTPSPARSSTSACTSSTTPSGSLTSARARTSTSRRRSRTWRPASGTRSSSSRRTTWASRRAPSARPS